MKAEREKWSGRVTAKALRFQTGQYELAEEEEICRIILVSGGSFTLVRGGESLLVNPGCVLLLGPGGGLLQQAGHIAPELIGCRFPAGVLPVLKNLMQRDFMALFERENKRPVRPGAVVRPPAHPVGHDAKRRERAGKPRYDLSGPHPALCGAGVPQ